MKKYPQDFQVNTTGRKDVVHDRPLSSVSQTRPVEKMSEKEVQKEQKKDKYLIPRFNKIYSSLRENDTTIHIVDAYATGNVSIVAGITTYAQNVTATLQSPIRLSQWPGGVQVYLSLITFSCSVQTSDTGCMVIYYNDNNGYITYLGTGQTNAGVDVNQRTILPSPITDSLGSSNTLNIGRLFFSTPGISVNNTLYYAMNFSYVYLLPAKCTYEVSDYE